MTRYLLIASRDPHESRDAEGFYDLAAGLARSGSAVTLFLVQDGVAPARPGRRSQALAALAEARVEVLADEFSLRERGIRADRLAAGVRPAAIDVVIDRLAEGARAFWH